MSKVVSVGTADVPYKFHQSQVRDFAYEHFLHGREDLKKLSQAFDNAAIETRRFSQPEEWFYKNHSFVERNEAYIKNAFSLSASAMKNCLQKLNAGHSENESYSLSAFDHIIFVSSTGVAAPTIDALLINEFKLTPHLKRTPIWGLGCVGGAVGISRALEYTRAFPKSAALVIALEICSLAFQKDDYSKSNIISIALFSDGAAASLVVGSEHRIFNNSTGVDSEAKDYNHRSNINLIDSLSTTYYDSLDVMGWEIIETGFKAIFSKDIPTIVSKYVRPNIEELLCKHHLVLSDIKHFVIHPGGLKVMNAYEDALALQNGALRYSRKVLREHGNMSSPTVLYVLKEFLDDGKYKPGDYGLLSALGPGFSSELILFQT